ncbi:MAG: T9SS type A sorting domain-containing protein [Lewinellaceae bacterium]|nr:T9SS type A sorting domain-containing protein [Lewinellaceae bacterium]
MQNHLRYICLLLLPVVLWGQSNTPIGWASVDGGTTGGAGGDTILITSRDQFVTYTGGTTPRVLLIEDTLRLNLYEMVNIGSNKTILGRGASPTLFGGGLALRGENIIVQNLRITGTYDGDWDGKTHSTDAITVYGQHIWIDHCDLSASADGLLDIRADGAKAADYVTISWTRLSNHNKVMLFGSSDDEIANRNHLRITIHHCWFDGYPGRGVNQRMPRIRFGDVHIFNSFYDEIDSYCIAARFESDVVVENNYFRNSKNPHAREDIGLGLEDPDLVASGNFYDASTGTRSSSGTAFSPAAFYVYSLQDAITLPGMIMNGAGLFNPLTNTPPVAVPDTVIRAIGAPASFLINPLANDTDADGDTDLRLSDIIRVGRGSARVLRNAITYQAPGVLPATDTILYQLVDTHGGIDTGRVVIQFGTTTDIKELTDGTWRLAITPNPASEFIQATYQPRNQGEIQLELWDLEGRRFPLQTNTSTTNQVDQTRSWELFLPQVPSGAYLVVVREGPFLSAQKILITH